MRKVQVQVEGFFKGQVSEEGWRGTPAKLNDVFNWEFPVRFVPSIADPLYYAAEQVRDAFGTDLVHIEGEPVYPPTLNAKGEEIVY